jgi:preprotein translocase subunit SecA
MPTVLIDDKVWWNQARKLAGICEEIAAAKDSGANVLLLAHFEGTLANAEAALRGRAIESKRFSQFDSTVLCSAGAGSVWSGLARSFPAPYAHVSDEWGATRLQPLAATAQETPLQTALQIIVAEHHPRRSKDQQLLEAAATLTCEAQLTVHIALDDPLLIHFGVRSIQDLYRRLGIDEETSLSNPLITTAIRRAQEKIESQVPRDLPAWSIEDWFRHNLAQKDP